MQFLFTIIALVIVITIHEFAHAWTANYLGDPTAKLEGRISLNPLKHLDPIGTIMMFIIKIGWGKPVPVNPNNFRNPKKDEAITSLAGPLSNLFLAILLAFPIKHLGQAMIPEIQYFLETILDISIILFAFNMLPFPPLDGSKFIQLIIPRKYHLAYDNFLQNGTAYFLVFLLADQLITPKILGYSFLQEFIQYIFIIIKSIIFLGT